MTITERVVYIYNALRKAGMTYAGAIGTIGNLQGETSDFDPMSCETSYLNRFKLTDAEYTRRADNGEIIYNGKYFEKDSAGYGIAQWTWCERKRNLLNYAKSQGKSVGDLDVQIAFMIKEMQMQYTSVWKVVSTTTDYTKAVKICVTDYEKPANQQSAIEVRSRYAKNWNTIISDKDVALSQPDVPKKDDTSTISGFDRKRVIKLALDQVGYLEKRNNSQLDDKIANAGSANYTKYARDLDSLGNFYNGSKQGFAWCDIFVDWLFVKCFGIENALNLLCQKYESSGAGCTYSMAYYRANGQFHARNEKPQVGDQIFFGSGLNDSNHTGIVYRVDGDMVYTIEGNTSSASGVIPNGGAVCKKAYKRNYINIIGYGRPKYNDGFNGDSIATDSTPSTDIPKEDNKQESAKEITNMPMLKKGDKGTNVKKAQQLLIAKGYSCGYFGADGDFGDGTISAVKAFQKANNLEVDGVIGEATWAALLEDAKEDKPAEVKKDNVPAPIPSSTQFDRQKLIDVAMAEIGYLEKKSESQLDNREANAGQKNFNKYARDLDAIQDYYYHDRKQGLNWCDIFCDWCFVKAYGVNDSFTVNCQSQYSYGAGCPQSMAYYKAQNRFDMKPQVGDQFFLSDGMGSTGHTGLVVGVSDTMVDTIEGNQEVRNGVDGVVKKKRYIYEIAGFGHPVYNDGYGTDDYIGKKPEEEKPSEPQPDEPKETKVEFNPPMLKRGDKGISVKKLQHLLIDSGISCGSSGADADFGSGTLNAVKIAQAKAKLSATGIADEAVWAWLIKY